jgi:hypothetical protein
MRRSPVALNIAIETIFVLECTKRIGIFTSPLNDKKVEEKMRKRRKGEL